jgi:tetratricopeptide (TPR) repeat protein
MASGYLSDALENLEQMSPSIDAETYFLLRADLLDNLGLIGEALDSLQELTIEDPLVDQKPEYHLRHAALFWKLGERESALKLLDLIESMTELEPERYKDLLGETYRLRGVLMLTASEFDEAMTHLQKAVTIFQENLSLKMLVGTLQNIAVIHTSRGHTDQALEVLFQCKELETDDQTIRSYILCSIGEMYEQLGNLDRAMDYYTQARILADLFDISETEARSFCNLGSIALRLGNWDEGFLFFSRALEIFRQTGNQFEISRVLTTMGRIYRELVITDRALAAFHEVKFMLQTLDSPLELARVLFDIVTTLCRVGRWSEAEEELEALERLHIQHRLPETGQLLYYARIKILKSTGYGPSIEQARGMLHNMLQIDQVSKLHLSMVTDLLEMELDTVITSECGTSGVSYLAESLHKLAQFDRSPVLVRSTLMLLTYAHMLERQSEQAALVKSQIDVLTSDQQIGGEIYQMGYQTSFLQKFRINYADRVDNLELLAHMRVLLLALPMRY